MKRVVVFVTLLALLILISSALAMRSDNYWLDWYVNLTGGGGPTNSANFAANLTIGQTASGSSSSANSSVGLGYWYGIDTTHRIYLPLTLRD
jgi:hypothetical protein